MYLRHQTITWNRFALLTILIDRLIASVIANFKQVVKDGDLRLHPLITRLVDKETLEKMGAKPVGSAETPS